MRDETVDNCLVALKFVPDWFGTSKMIKKIFTDFSAQMIICSILMKILVTPYFLIMKWVF